MKLKTGWAIAIMVILMAGSVVFGAYRGWTDERARVNETYAGLESMLQTRVESAYNVLAVAQRYEDGMDDTARKAYENIREDLKTLESGIKTLSMKARANDDFSRSAETLLNALSQLEKVKADARDQWYVTTYLPQMLDQSEQKTVGAAYNQAAAEFNSRMRGTFSGWLARTVLGVKPAEEFIAR